MKAECANAPVCDSPLDGPIQLTSVTVRRGRLVAELMISDERMHYATPELAALVQKRCPNIGRHACVNGVGRRFEAVMNSTSVAHLLEHIAIDFQVRDTTELSAQFVGTTEWVDEQAGSARIELSFRDDLEALTAFNMALQFLNNAVITCFA